MLRRATQIALGTALVAAAVAFAPAAHAEHVGFNVSIGGPGYGVSFGNGPYWHGDHYYRPNWGSVYPRGRSSTRRRSLSGTGLHARVRAPRVVYRAPHVARPVVVARPSITGIEAHPWPGAHARLAGPSSRRPIASDPIRAARLPKRHCAREPESSEVGEPQHPHADRCPPRRRRDRPDAASTVRESVVWSVCVMSQSRPISTGSHATIAHISASWLARRSAGFSARS